MDPLPANPAAASPRAALMSRDDKHDAAASLRTGTRPAPPAAAPRRSWKPQGETDDAYMQGISLAALVQADRSDPTDREPAACWCCSPACPYLCWCDGQPSFAYKCLGCVTGLMFWRAGMYAPGGTFRRESWDQLTKGGRVPPGVDKKTGVRSRDVAVPARHAASVPVRIFESPDAGRAQPILLWMHGGGFSLGSAADKFTHQLCAELCARLGMSVVSVDYRLAPEHPFPAAWQDCYDVLRWLACDARGAVAGDADRIVVGGDSAGANLALFLAGLARDGLDGDLQPTSARIHVCHQVLLYPALFLPTFVRSKNVFDNNRERAVMENLFLPQPTRNFFLLSTFGSFARLEELHRKDRRVAPLLAKTADLPPTVVVSGGLDSLQHENRFLVHMLKKEGVPTTHLHFPDMPHAFALLPFGREYRETWDGVAKELAYLSEAPEFITGMRVLARPFGMGVVLGPKRPDGVQQVDFGWAKGFLASTALLPA